jgi:hypothetical protein
MTEDSRDLEVAHRLYLAAADGFENLLGSASNAEGFQPYDQD